MRFKVIPGLPNHDVVYGATTGVDGKIYLGTSNEFYPGLHALIHCYDPATDQVTEVADFSRMFPEARDLERPPHSKIHLTLCVGARGRVFAASHVTAPPVGDQTHRIWEVYDDPRRGYSGGHIVMHDPATGETSDLGIAAPREGIRVMEANPDRDELYMISYPRSHFLVHRVATGETIDVGRISFENSFGICYSRVGFAYTADDDGYLLRYDPERVRIERLPLRIPDAPWRTGEGNIIRRMAMARDGVRMYGFGAKSVRLFEYDPAQGPRGRITDFGVLCGEDRPEEYGWLPPAKAITVGLDGKVYCALGNRTYHAGPEPATHLFSFDPETRATVDHGPIQAEGYPPILDCQDATAGQDGRIYLAPRVMEQPLRFLIFTPGEEQTVREAAAPALTLSLSQGEREQEPPFPLGKGRREDCRPYRPWLEGLLPPAEPPATTLERDNLAQWMINTEPSAFVSEGHLTLRELGWRGQTPRIPDGESAITALAAGFNGKLYGGTSGERAHLFVYSPFANSAAAFAHPLDLGALGEGQRVCRSLVALRDAVYAGTTSDRLEGYRGGHLYRHRLSAEAPCSFDHHGVPPFPFDPDAGPQLEDLGVPVEGEGIYALAGDAGSGVLYGLTYPGARFFVYEPRDGTVRVVGQVATRNLSRALVVAPGGQVYGSGDYGRLFRYEPEFDAVRQLSVQLPAGKGREYLNGLDSAAVAPNGAIYGGTIADGYLFRLEPDFNPDRVRVVNLGKPIRQPRIRAITVCPDGRVYGFAGEPDNIGRLFVYSPGSGEIRELGIPRVGGVPRFWAGYEFEAMATGPGGEIFMGESDRISHLFVYYPPAIMGGEGWTTT